MRPTLLLLLLVCLPSTLAVQADASSVTLSAGNGQKTSPSGGLSDESSYSGYTHGTPGPFGPVWLGPNSGHLKGTVDYGRIQTSQHAYASGGYYYWGSAGQYRGCASTSNTCDASWLDTITIDSAGQHGTQGSLKVNLAVTRAVSNSSGSVSSGLNCRLSNNSGFNWYATNPSQNGTLVQTSAVIPFTYGTAFTLGVYVSATCGASGSNGTGSLDSAYNVSWLGFDQLLDSDGNVVTSYSLSSESGFNWASAVPEPTSILALVAGLAGLGLVSRRK